MVVVDDESYYNNVVHDIFSNKGLSIPMSIKEPNLIFGWKVQCINIHNLSTTTGP